MAPIRARLPPSCQIVLISSHKTIGLDPITLRESVRSHSGLAVNACTHTACSCFSSHSPPKAGLRRDLQDGGWSNGRMDDDARLAPNAPSIGEGPSRCPGGRTRRRCGSCRRGRWWPWCGQQVERSFSTELFREERARKERESGAPPGTVRGRPGSGNFGERQHTGSKRNVGGVDGTRTRGLRRDRPAF